MKYSIFTILAIYFSVNSYAQTEQETDEFSHHCLFEEKSVTIGIAPSYSANLERIGFNSRLYYNLGEHLCFGPELSFFKTNGEKVHDMNLVGHYIFETKLVGLYPLLGINYTVEEKPSHTEKEFGALFGAGLHRNFNMITLFAEYTHVQSKLKDDFITMGLMLTLK